MWNLPFTIQAFVLFLHVSCFALNFPLPLYFLPVSVAFQAEVYKNDNNNIKLGFTLETVYFTADLEC